MSKRGRSDSSGAVQSITKKRNTRSSVIKDEPDSVKPGFQSKLFYGSKQEALSKDRINSVKLKENKRIGLRKRVKDEVKEEEKPVIEMEPFEKDGVKREAPSSDDSDCEENEADKVSEYERKRLQNIQDNREFFSKLGILQAKEDFLLSSGVKPKAVKSTIKPKQQKVKEVLPRRASMRLANKEPSSSGLSMPDQPMYQYPVEEHPRKPSGPLKMTETLYSMEESEGEEYLSSLQRVMKTECWTVEERGKVDDCNRFLKSLDKMKLNENRVAKVVIHRIMSVAVHPSKTKVLAAAGDKWGNIGLWDVESTNSSENQGVCLYEPHSRPVNCLKFGVSDPNRLYSCSYDGSVRCCDLQKGVFNELYRTSEEDEERCCSFDFVDPHTLAVGLGDGTLVIKDERTAESESPTLHQISERVIKCVSVHPVNSYSICTSGNDGKVNLWDTRNMKKTPKPYYTFSCSRSCNSAYFSPVTGNNILTTSLDDQIRIYNIEDAKVQAATRHDNHVGRWLTGFRADWHPSREDVFIVGSMHRPRRIEMFNNRCQMVKTFNDSENMTSVCSINAFHPSRNILVGGNASGRLHVFMQIKDYV